MTEQKQTSVPPDEPENFPSSVFLIYRAQIIPILGRVTRLGRRLDNDIVIMDVTISRYHAEIHFKDGEFTLIDLNSTGGTFLNNQRVHQSTLYTGDIIVLSNEPLMFFANDASLEQSTSLSTGFLVEMQQSSAQRESFRKTSRASIKPAL